MAFTAGQITAINATVDGMQPQINVLVKEVSNVIALLETGPDHATGEIAAVNAAKARGKTAAEALVTLLT